MTDQPLYRSKTQYFPILDTEENQAELNARGYYPSMGPTGFVVVFDETHNMISDIISQENFDDRFELIPVDPPAN